MQKNEEQNFVGINFVNGRVSGREKGGGGERGRKFLEKKMKWRENLPWGLGCCLRLEILVKNIVFDRRPSPLVLERIVKSLTIPPSQCVSNDSNLSSGSDTTCRTVCLTDPSNNQLVKDEGTQIFYHIRSQTKPIGIGVNCEIPHNVNYIAYIFMHLNLKNIKRFNFNLLCFYVIL